MNINIISIGSLIIIYGILAVFSVSIYESFDITSALWEPSNYFYFLRQIINIWLGIVVWYIVYKSNINLIRKLRRPIIVIILILQLSLFTPRWQEYNWAKLWLDLPFFRTLQPWEFFKLWFVLLISDRLVRKQKILNTTPWLFGYLMVSWVCYTIFLFLKDSWTVLVLALTSFLLYRYNGGRKRNVITMSVLWLVWAIVVAMNASYIKQRVLVFIDPSNDTSAQIWRQTSQALIAIWWGWFLGRWYGKWLQKFGYLPEAQSDYIFAAYAEEVWFLWMLLLISFYAILAWYFLYNLKYIKDPYLRSVWVGIMWLIIIQATINMAVNLNLMPTTWLTLPFVSFGGTAMIVNIVELVILHKIISPSKWEKIKKIHYIK